MAILVTGGTKGVGLAIAHRFAQPNADVFLNYRADDAGAEQARHDRRFGCALPPHQG
jgi:enoyl-[acyl-carrier protein] reductase III